MYGKEVVAVTGGVEGFNYTVVEGDVTRDTSQAFEDEAIAQMASNQDTFLIFYSSHMLKIFDFMNKYSRQFEQ